MRRRLSNLLAKLFTAATVLSTAVLAAAVAFNLTLGPLTLVAGAVFASACAYIFWIDLRTKVTEWWTFRWAGKWHRRCSELRSQGRCTSCAYDLTGNVSGVCPECGMVRTSPAANSAGP